MARLDGETRTCAECGGPVYEVHGAICLVCLADSEDTSEDPTVIAPPAGLLARQTTEESLEAEAPRPRRPAAFERESLESRLPDPEDRWVTVAMGWIALSVLLTLAAVLLLG